MMLIGRHKNVVHLFEVLVQEIVGPRPREDLELAPQELPVGVLTALLGGGYLLWLMHRGGGLGGAGAR